MLHNTFYQNHLRDARPSLSPVENLFAELGVVCRTVCAFPSLGQGTFRTAGTRASPYACREQVFHSPFSRLLGTRFPVPARPREEGVSAGRIYTARGHKRQGKEPPFSASSAACFTGSVRASRCGQVEQKRGPWRPVPWPCGHRGAWWCGPGFPGPGPGSEVRTPRSRGRGRQ